MAFKCEKCGQEHEGLPTDIGYRGRATSSRCRHKRGRRCQFTDDIGVIDGKRYYIRGVLYVPIRDTGGEFGWGLWRASARRTSSAIDPCGPSMGRMSRRSADISAWKTSRATRGSTDTKSRSNCAASERPTFHLSVSEHRLSREQHSGITVHEVEEILANCSWTDGITTTCRRIRANLPGCRGFLVAAPPIPGETAASTTDRSVPRRSNLGCELDPFVGTR